MTEYLAAMFGFSLAFTMGIELAVALLFGLRSRRELCLVLLVNALTNPPAVLCCLLFSFYLPDVPAFAVQCAAEAAAVAAEAYIYNGFSVRHPALLSVCANFAAWFFGIVFS